MITQNFAYQNFPNCVRLFNERVELIVTTDVGPRIIKYALLGGENILGEHPTATVETALGAFKPYGGHRLWIAPENMPNSYAPDNSPVEFMFDELGNSAMFIQPLEPVTRTQKQIRVKLDAVSSRVEITHQITNLSNAPVTMSAWALTIMRGGGECVIPNEPFAEYSGETLLPVRNLAVWSYTDFADSRWTFAKNHIRLRTDANLPNPQKIGVCNKQGVAVYEWQNLRFVKRFNFVENAIYPDLNSNTELYTAGDFIELETLSPLRKIEPNQSINHVERWELSSI